MIFIGKQEKQAGFFTLQRFVQGKTMREIESILGFRSGKFSRGVTVFTATVLPKISEFELAGYSQVAGHRTEEVYGDLNSVSGKSEDDALTKRKQLAMSQWSLYGSSRLIKFSADIGHTSHSNSEINRMLNDYQYPPGRGIPQWVIPWENAVTSKIIARLENYPDERFEPDQGYKKFF